MASPQGFECYCRTWKVALYIFPTHKSSLPKYHSTYQSAGGVFSLTLSSSSAGLLCALSARWCAFCLHETEFMVVTFITACHREAHGAFLLSYLSSILLRFISKWPRVSGDLQHQASVTQTSLWLLYMYFVWDFLHVFFLDGCLADKHTYCIVYDHSTLPLAMALSCCEFRGTLDFMPASFRDLRTVGLYW